MVPKVPTSHFVRSDRHRHPAEIANGPFGGLHGGAVAGLLAGECETLPAVDGLAALAANVQLMRPAPFDAFETHPAVMRQGKRAAFVQNELQVEGETVATATVNLFSHHPVDAFGPPPDAAHAAPGPAALPECKTLDIMRKLADRTGFLQSIDTRQNADMIWVKPLVPLLDRPTPLGTILSIADCSTLFSLVLTERPDGISGYPNANLSVHLSRPPAGQWIGVKPRSCWYNQGYGLTEAEIFDEAGRLGRSLQNVVLLR